MVHLLTDDDVLEKIKPQAVPLQNEGKRSTYPLRQDTGGFL